MPAIETYIVTHTFTTRVGATSPQDALTRAHGEIVGNEQAALLTERGTTVYAAPKVAHVAVDDEAAPRANLRRYWTEGPGSPSAHRLSLDDFVSEKPVPDEDRAVRAYAGNHRHIVIDTSMLGEHGTLVLPGHRPKDEEITLTGTLRAGGTVMDPDGIRIETDGDTPDPDFPEVSGRLVRTLRRLFDEYGEMGTIMVAAKMSPSAMILCAEQPIDWHPDYEGVEREPEPPADEPAPTAEDIIDRIVDREALADLARHVAKISQAIGQALAQVQVPQVVLTLSPESLASIDALRDTVASSMRAAVDPTSPRQG
jgi:hypothetical protein